MDLKTTVLDNLIEEIATPLQGLAVEEWQQLEEIRLRVNQPVFLRFAGTSRYLAKPDSLSQDQLKRMMLLLSRSSFYALEEELRQGFITIPGGHRIGFVGEGVMENHHLRTLKNISSLNFRIARPVLGAAKPILPYIFSWDLTKKGFVAKGLLQTLIISPPKVGKTTVLRDLVRILADGLVLPNSLEVGIADERFEIAAVFGGVPQMPIGVHCDVISGCTKAEAILLLIRSMSPDVIVTDEIGSIEDSKALADALNAGIKVVATAHGGSYEEVSQRPNLGSLLQQGFFQRIVVLKRLKGMVMVAKVYDEVGRLVELKS